MSDATIDRQDAGKDERRVSIAQLKEALSSLGRERRQWTLDQILEYVAVAMLPLGAIVILLGWWGAAHTPLLVEQVPYLISGGLFGLGLMVGGGMLYLGSWIARSAAQRREQAQDLRAALDELAGDLRGSRPVAAASGQAPAASDEAPAPAVTSSLNGPVRFLATPSGTMFHRPECGIVAGRQDLREVSGNESDLEPCGMCTPLRTEDQPAPA